MSTAAPSGDGAARNGIAVRAEQAVKVYGRGDAAVRALNGIDASFAKGRYTAIMGPSGSGKSTLMHCLAGLDTLTSGRIVFGGVELSSLDEKARTQLRRDRVGFVFQTFNLVPTLNVTENVLLPMSIAGREPDRQWVDQILATLGLRDRLRHRPSELSGGQQQRVAVARALASRPEVVFADEPTGNLDSRASAELLDILRKAVHEFGQTVVMVTHDPSAATYADEAIFLNDGRVVDHLDAPTADAVLERMTKLGV